MFGKGIVYMNFGQAVFMGLAFVLETQANAADDNCQTGPDYHTDSIIHEVAGDRDYSRKIVGSDWFFELRRAEFGWNIAIVDSAGLDLSQMTPPLRGDVNPRQIYGWHFRNTDNSAPNTGEVNAPQTMRVFGFDPALSGTGGYRPGDQNGVDPLNQPGCGILIIDDMGLADLKVGEKARLNYLKFSLMLTWPRTEHQDHRAKNALPVAAEY